MEDKLEGEDSVTHAARHFILSVYLNLLNAELNPICHLLALLGAHLILHISRMKVNFFKNAFLFVRVKG